MSDRILDLQYILPTSMENAQMTVLGEKYGPLHTLREKYGPWFLQQKCPICLQENGAYFSPIVNLHYTHKYGPVIFLHFAIFNPLK